MLEVFCVNFIHMENTSDPAQFLHFSRALLNGIHRVFPLPQVSGYNGKEPISKKEIGVRQSPVGSEKIGSRLDGLWRNTVDQTGAVQANCDLF